MSLKVQEIFPVHSSFACGCVSNAPTSPARSSWRNVPSVEERRTFESKLVIGSLQFLRTRSRLSNADLLRWSHWMSLAAALASEAYRHGDAELEVGRVRCETDCRRDVHQHAAGDHPPEPELEHRGGLVAAEHRLAGEHVVGLVMEVDKERQRGIRADGKDRSAPQPECISGVAPALLRLDRKVRGVAGIREKDEWIRALHQSQGPANGVIAGSQSDLP